jgi:hypothetical protein
VNYVLMFFSKCSGMTQQCEMTGKDIN